MATILITGGAGFIGSHTADALLSAGHRVRVLDILDPQIHGSGGFPAYLDPRVERQRGDVCDAGTVAAALEGVDAVYHLAARTGVGQSMYRTADYVATNVTGTAVLLDAVARLGRPLGRLVLASSRATYGEGAAGCAVHGIVHPGPRRRTDLEQGAFHATCPVCGDPVRPAPTREDAPLAPVSVYALTKLMQEQLCRQAAASFGLPLVILRYFNVYGPRQSLENPYTGVVTVFSRRLRSGDPIALYERGFPVRDFVHVSDVVRANLAALERSLPQSTCLNVGSGQPVTVRGLVAAMAQILGVEPRIEDLGEFRIGDIFACTADLARSGSLIGYHPTVSLEQGLRDFMAWADEQPAAGGPSFEQTVAELREHGLLGQAGGSPVEPSPGRRLQLRPDR